MPKRKTIRAAKDKQARVNSLSKYLIQRLPHEGGHAPRVHDQQLYCGLERQHLCVQLLLWDILLICAERSQKNLPYALVCISRLMTCRCNSIKAGAARTDGLIVIWTVVVSIVSAAATPASPLSACLWQSPWSTGCSSEEAPDRCLSPTAISLNKRNRVTPNLVR